MRPGDEHHNVDPVQAPLTPDFPFPVRIPSFLLAEHLQLRGKEYIEGIATSSHVDLDMQLLLYRVHLEHGFTININVGFVEIIRPQGEDMEMQHHTRFQDTTDREEDDQGGRPSSCDEVDDDDENYNMWAPELLHTQSQDFASGRLHSELHEESHEGDLEVQEAARLLMSCGEVLEGDCRADTQRGKTSRSGRGKGRAAGSGRGRGQSAPGHVGSAAAPAPIGRVGRPPARDSAAAHLGRAATAPGPAAASPSTRATSSGWLAATSSWGDPEPASYQAPFNMFPDTGTTSVPDFYGGESSESDGDDLDHGSDGDGNDGDPENVRFAYRESTWSKNHQTYNLEPISFEDDSIGLTGEYTEIPSYIHLFEQFWTFHMLRDICLETNRYAGSLDEKGRARGGHGWYPVTVRELKVFLATSLYMGMKKLPNVKAYWAKSEEIFYCNVIAGLFTRKRFTTLMRCLHITDPSTYVADNTSPHFDKMHQTRWLIDAIRGACKEQWNLG
jgi:hypothetical protein